MRLILEARLEYGVHTSRAAMQVTELQDPYIIGAFEPLKMTDDICGRIMGDALMGDKSVQAKVRLRKDVAKEIAHALTKLIMAEMESRDKFNGYPIEKGEYR